MERYGYPRPGDPPPATPPPGAAPSGPSSSPPPPAPPTFQYQQWPPATPPPSAPAAPARPRRGRRGLVILSAFALAAAAAGAGLLGFFRGTGDSLISSVPASSSVYFTVYLDPSGGQKLALNNLLNKFPNLKDSTRDASINQWLDDALKSSGMNHTDIRSWFGSQVSVVVDQISSLQNTPPVALIAASKDDSAAQAALGKAAASDKNTSKDTYDGVTIYNSNSSYVAAFNHMLVVGTTNAEVKKVIDTAHGRGASLANDARYQKVLSQLPGDRFAIGFFDVGSILKAVSSQSGVQFPFTTMGLSLSAQNDGLQMDSTANWDSSKLSAQQRSALTAPAHPNAATAFIPAKSLALLAFSNLNATLGGNAALAQNPMLAGVAKLLGHLNGDAAAGLNVDLSNTADPFGLAVAAQVDDPNATAADLVSLEQQNGCSLAQTFNSVASGLGDLSASQPQCTYQDTTQTYKGSTLHVLQQSQDGGAPTPVLAWTASGQILIAGNDAAAVENALDAKSGSGIASDPTYTSALGHVYSPNTGVYYVNVQSVYNDVKQMLGGGSATAGADTWVAPIKSIIGSGQNYSDHSVSRTFITIG